uniref:PDZ domain containing 8 n=1 Tax=Sparus aurata TaxID=8175 RepID=A0A671USR3_SPAAU
MIYLILISALSGAVVTLVLQFLLIYRRNTEPIARAEQYVKVVPDHALKDYFNTQHADPGQQQQDTAAFTASKQQESVPARQQEAAVSGGSPKQQPPPTAQSEPADATKPETCNFLNAIFLFLFRELRDTPVVRHWLTKKIKVEFEELLQTKTAGRLLEGLSLRDISLGNSLPIFKTAKLMKPVHLNEEGMPEELNFEVDIEYNGVYLQLSLHSFLDGHGALEQLLQWSLPGQFAGRLLLKNKTKGSSVLSLYKSKESLSVCVCVYKPFFPFQVQAPLGSTCDLDLSVQDSRLVEGRLKVTLIECSRLFVLGSYERETYVHCTLELSSYQWKEKTRSSIKRTEVIKGPCGSVGMTFRHVPASEGDAVHVSIETVTPNSPAALADLQKGDRLIAIGGVKVTSSVQVPKLLKQAGDRVVVFYERPVRHQTPSFGSLGTLQEGFGQIEETGFISQPGGYEEDPAPITTLSDISDSKDMDSEFEELIVDSKQSQAGGPNSSTTNTSDTKEDSLLTVNQSPKRTVANLATKPLGTISPILNRKLNLVGLQSPLKPQPKETPKPSPHKTSSDPGEGLQRPTIPPPPPPSRPQVPPRPQIKLTSAPPETSLLEGIDSVTTTNAGTDKMSLKQAEGKQSTRQTECSDELPVSSTMTSNSKVDQAKDKTSDSSCSTRDILEDHSLWESPETMFRNQTAHWNKASVVFEVEGNHKFLNVALWCKDPFKLGSLLCLGHVSLQLEHLALECMATSSAEYQSTFRLGPPEPRANVSRTALRGLSTHKGFNEKLCYGDVTLNFCYLPEGELAYPGGLAEREREGSLHHEDLREREREHIPSAPRDDLAYGAMQLVEVRHNFQDTQFQNPTWCEYCKKKVWTKAASQCMICAYVCHKKCQDKCLTENPFCVAATERRGADPEAKSTLNRATSGLTRHIINTSSRLLNLRQVPKTRLVEQVADVLPGVVEPSPKHTPNTSDNESSDTETYTSGASPSKQPASSGGSSKLVRKEGGLDDSVFIAVKEIGRDLYRGLPTDERSQKLELMLDKLQQEIDQELEHNNALLLEEREATDARRKALISTALAKSGERLQALTLLMIHYRAGIEDLESVESTSPSEQQGFKGKGEALEEESLMGTEVYDSDICSPVEVQLLDDITEEQICVEALQ